MRWTWHDVMALPAPVYAELREWLNDEALARESGDGDVFDMDAP